MSPVAAVNVPPTRSHDKTQRASKLGTVGRVLPGCSAKVVHPETFEDVGLNTEGLLMIKGPNIMCGYLDEPEKTAAVVRDGWYNTGDFAKLDEEGFIEITGRQSRFSKIGGEMVPHIKVEEELIRCLEELEAELPAETTNGEPHEDEEDHRAELRIAVTSVPDERKGERLIVLHKPLPVAVDAILKRMGSSGLPNLWLPGGDSFLEVQEIPLLGTGKLDLRGVQDVALAAFAPHESVTS